MFITKKRYENTIRELRNEIYALKHSMAELYKGYPYYRPDIQYSLHPYDMFIQPDRIPYNDLFGLILKYLGLRVDRQETVKHRLVKDDNDKNLSE